MIVTTAKHDAQLNFASSDAIASRDRRTKPGRALLITVVSTVMLLLQNIGFAASVNQEYSLKAAFLYNICKFVEWPSERFVDADSPLVIGVLGTHPLGGELERLLGNRKINSHRIVIKQVMTIDEARVTHVLFVATNEEPSFIAMRAELAKGAVLTVGESRTFLRASGIISVMPVQDKLSFEINMVDADQAHLKISAQMQKLAAVVWRSR